MNGLATKSEIQGWISDAQRKQETYHKIAADCDKQIARLEPVYRKLGELKENFRSARKSTENIFDEKGTWRGERYKAFCNAGEALDDTCKAYYQKLDAAQDEVNRKIGKLKGKKQEQILLVGRLMKQVTQWQVDIENALN